MNICLYSGGIEYFRTGGIKTAYANKAQAFELCNAEYSTHPFNKPFDILQLEFPSPQSVFYALWARKHKKKVSMGTHVTVEDFKHTFTFSSLVVSLIKYYLTWYYSLADLLIAPSAYTKQLLIEYGVKTPIEVVSNGINPSFLERAGNVSQEEHTRPIVGSVGFVTQRKGVGTFSIVAERCPTYTFKWAGTIHNSLLFNLHSIRTPDNVEFLGYVEDIQNLYASFDAFLFPSFEENQGIVILEAACFGLPLIIRDLPAYTGWLVHEENCLKCRNDTEFVEQLHRVFSDDSLREKLSINARKLAEANELTHIGEQLLSCYETLLK
jgi:1,2-diacylglycerol-3-alpha-glucose alpha-1,2-glucosyltransferase